MTETIITVTIRHTEPLPELLATILEHKAYDYCTAKNNLRIEVEAKVWSEVTVA